ncbi:Hybrid PKS-NRPS synthetase like protein [Verticillium longisporum]|nr:Hybrid PKS-NRPS synthetase like protein [Verticillium longisporum]
MLTASSTYELAQKLAENDVTPQDKGSGNLKRVAFIFTGQGAQWPSMGKHFIDASPLFRAIVQQSDEVLQSLDDGPSWSAMEELSKPKQTSRVYESALSQPLCAILQIGLVEVWRSWGVSPVAVVGHSSGEIGAAYCAGIMSLRDCVIAAYYRGLYLGSGASEKELETESGPKLKGTMCAVGLGEDAAKDVLKAYPCRLVLAAVNSPSSCTLSGDEDAILEVVESCKVNGTFCRQLRVDMAYHSHHMLPKAPKYEAAMVAAGVGGAHADADHVGATSGCRMFSSVRGREVTSRDCSPAYWKENMVSTESFTAALTELSRHAAIDALVELGPHPALKGPVQDTLASLSMGELPYFSSLSRGEPDFQALLSSAGSMTLAGLDLDLVHINAFEIVVQDQTTGRVLTDLPGYVWDHSTPFWAESRVSKNYRLREHPRHDLLGARKSSDNPLSMSWRNLISPKEAPWLAEWINQPHATVLPWSMHVLMAVEAARQASSSSTDVIRIEKLNLHQDLLLSTFTSDDTVVEFHFNLHRAAAAGSHYTFSIEAGVSVPDAAWTKLSSGSIISLSSEAASSLSSPHAFKPENKVRHDERGLKRAQSFPVPTLARTSDLQFNSTNAAALLSDNPLGACSPLALDSVLRLPTLMLLGAPLPPSQYRLRSIRDIEVSTRRLEPSESAGHEFPSIVTSSAPVNGIALASAKILAKDGETLIDRRDAEYVAVAPLQADPALESLFFQRTILPDITYAGNSDSDSDYGTGQDGHALLSLARFFELLTHKWPMSDLAIDVGKDDGLDAAADHVVSGLQKLSWSTNRPRFRSLTIVKESTAASESGSSVTSKWPVDNRVSIMPSLDSDPDAQFHAIFTLSDRYESALSRVHPSGFICLLNKTKSQAYNQPDSQIDAAQFTWPPNLEPVYSAQSKDGWEWNVGRRRSQKGLTGSETDAAERSESSSSGIGFRVFAPAESLPRTFRLAGSDFEAQDVSALRDESLFSEPFDAIILDTGDTSVLLRDATRPDESLTWTQSLVGHVQTLLWVSSASMAQPFNGVDGAFIRTLATENPRFRGVSIAVSENVGDRELESLCGQIYERTRNGDAEVELYIQDGAVHCLRYHPDDELSASADLVPATRNSTPHGFEYKINGVGNGRVEMITTVPSLPNIARVCGSEPLVGVLVKVSLVSGEDVAKVHGNNGPLAREGLAAFFIGRTLEASDSDRPYGNRVFGWCSGAHASTVYVHASQMIHLEDHVTVDDAQDGEGDLSLVRALGRLASQATSACLVAFEGRVRQNDRIRANKLSAAIRIAVTAVAARNSAVILDDDSDHGNRQQESAHDLDISYDGSSGFLVNGRHVRLASVLDRYALATVLAASVPLDAKSLPEVNVFGIQDFAEAFEHAAKNPLSTTILRHAGGLGSLNAAWITARTTATTDEKQQEEQLFRGDGAYIVLGGLGGLGQHLLPWMVKNGAKHVVALGRKSPLSTEGALELTDRIAGLDEVEAALALVRTETPIGGVINMAMVLADRPFTTMTAEE